MSSRLSTILADLFTPLLFADLFSAVRASLRRRSNDEFDDGVAYGRQAWLRWRSVDSFFSVPLWRCGGVAKRRKQLSSLGGDGETRARTPPRSDRDRGPLLVADSLARRSIVPFLLQPPVSGPSLLADFPDNT